MSAEHVGARENGRASLEAARPAGRAAVAAAKATPIRCLNCRWNGSIGELVGFRCPECDSRLIARVS